MRCTGALRGAPWIDGEQANVCAAGETMIESVRRPFARSLQAVATLMSLVIVIASATADAAPDTMATASHPVLEDRSPERHTAFAGGVVGIADLVYSVQPGFRPLRLDLYLPPGAPGSHPLVVFIHG